ncbi:hypothetical protein CWS01_07720 [Niallia nealsonii]|uniref:Uncharacterized protein n=2 Tax=Niallia nealsonii TaxID=115979 RepID=A0A2N0Z463_9BACI|nr:hypothetical protein CWS01_07720 [Niallia nealsonii]
MVLENYTDLLEVYYPLIYRAFKGEDITKDGDLYIVEEILSKVSRIELVEIVGKMTGINNPSYMYCPKDKFPVFIGFND